jgi:hypothetical protein
LLASSDGIVLPFKCPSRSVKCKRMKSAFFISLR